MKIFYFIRTFTLTFTLILALPGCGNSDLGNLTAALKKIKQDNLQHKKITPPTLHVPKPVSFQSMSARATHTSPSLENPLQSVALNTLKFVGTVQQEGQLKAYLMAPDNMVYDVAIGDMIGNRKGKITQINSESVQITEEIFQGKKSQSQVTYLQLKE